MDFNHYFPFKKGHSKVEHSECAPRVRVKIDQTAVLTNKKTNSFLLRNAISHPAFYLNDFLSDLL